MIVKKSQFSCGLLILVFFSFSIQEALAQVRIRGTVRDEAGMALPGVSVGLKGTERTTRSDGNGVYEFDVPDTAAVILFSYVGYRSYERPVGNDLQIDVELLPDQTSLSEVVVVGYGTQQRSDVTGAVASFSADRLQIEQMPQTTITQSLQGRIPGLSITTTASNAEGNSNNIQVRGRNSITAGNAPLVVLDGIPYSDQLSEINPNDIASIEVLKDASSAAIYGSRAANGVILVTTKKGVQGKARVAYNGFYGIDQMAHLPDMMNATTFYDTKVGRYGEGALTRTEIESRAAGVNTDWIRLATQTGARQQHNLSISGGNEQIRYFMSGAYNTTRGIAINDEFKRRNFRINLDTKIAPWLTIGTNTQFGMTTRDKLSASFSGAFDMNPLALPFEEDGLTRRVFPWQEDAFFTNPLQGLDVLMEDATRNIISNNFLQIDVPYVEGLSYKLNTGYTYRYRNVETYYGRNTRPGLQQGGVSEIDNWANEDWLVENILNYDRSFGDHRIGFTGLYSAQSRTNRNHDLDANGFPSDIMTNYQNRLATVWSPSDQYTQMRYISQMARLNYNYRGKYLLTLTARRDGYSAFGDLSKFGVFPSVAAGWNIEQEPFLADARWVNTLKLRLSHGKNGNQAINPYSTLPALATQAYLTSDKQTAIGFYPNSLGDPSLGWETTVQSNFGLDFSLWNNKLSGTVDYYIANTSDLLLSRLISPVNGVRNITQNIGRTRNTGVDFVLSGTPVSREHFSWTTDFNLTHYKNKIVDVGLYDGQGNPIDDIGNRWFIGQPISVNFSYVFDGIWQENDDIANSAQPTAQPGDIRVRDADGDGTITTDDRQIIGSTVPSYAAGWNNTFRYKQFSLSFMLRTVQGITRFNEMMNTFFDGRTRTLNRNFWTPENPNNEFPANRDDNNPFGVIYFGRENNASFLRLSEVTFSYQLPPDFLQKAGLSSLEVFANAKNLATFTSWEGLDPELSSQRGIPLNRTYLFGLRFGF